MVGLLSVSDGPRITVDTLVGNPMLIPARVLELLANQFLSEALLRNAGPNTNGLVQYAESTPLYLGSDVETVAEFAEIPVGVGQIGLPRIAVGTKKGLGVRVSKEMRDENKIDAVNLQITQLTNTMIRAEERALRRLLSDPSIPTIAASVAWTDPNSKVRHDLAAAQEVVASAKPDGVVDDDEFFGFEPNTSVFPGAITPVLLDNEEFLKVYSFGQSSESIAYTGKMPGDVLGMAALRSRSWPRDRVLVCERGTLGFYSDTRPLQSTGLYGEGGGPNGGPTETWRSDTTRKRVIGADQPKAACWITGIVQP